MPTYEYQCSACQHNFELYQSFSAPPVTVCPECKAEKVSIKISGGAGIVFKGGGFYETDYKRGKGSEYQSQSESDGGKKAPSDTPSASSGDSKPSASSESPAAHSVSKSAGVESAKQPAVTKEAPAKVATTKSTSAKTESP